MNVVDYSRTALRPGWAVLPAPVRSSVESVLGGPVVTSAAAGGGFTPGFAAVVSDGSRQIFAKAAPATDTFIHPAYLREREVLSTLPTGLPIPQLLAAENVDSGGTSWQVLCFEAVSGYMPGKPWTYEDLDAIHTSLLRIQEGLAHLPANLTGGPMAEDFSNDPAINSIFASHCDAGTTPAFLPPLDSEQLHDLQQLCSASFDALQGNAVLHNDLRADNIIISQSQAYVCDWNFLSTGPAWADWVALLVYARHGGIDVGAWLKRSPLSANADPGRIDSWLAILAAYMVHSGNQPEVPNSPWLRSHARFTARITVDWLNERRWA